MRLLIVIMAVLCNVITQAQAITAAEFFVDTDPGVGNATPVAVTSGTTVNFSATVSTTSLSQGFHFVGIRTRGSDGKWGLYETRGFYISQATGNAGNITAAEFFIDMDPGVGNATPVAVTSGPVVTFTVSFPVTALSPGFHFTGIRTRDADGRWGLYEARGFYISGAATNVGNITAAEFYVDSDPGVGAGTAVTITPGPVSSFIATIPTASLSPGFHFAVVRARDSDGKWGLFESRGFYISTQTATVANMVAAEYFIDADPGPGNGTPVSTPNAATINQNFVLNVPPGTSNGQHLLAIRFRDADGRWGLFDFDTINVAAVLPLRFLSFEATKNRDKVTLQWKTTEEANTSHFDIERSINGVDFTVIGRVNSRNVAGVHQYTMDDGQPHRGINLYRLKQVDLDGSFSYSHIAKVLFDPVRTMAVYPNPASEKISIVLDKPSAKWMSTIYDSRGVMVKQELATGSGTTLELNVAVLPAGTYSIVLNNGMETIHARFVKQ